VVRPGRRQSGWPIVLRAGRLGITRRAASSGFPQARAENPAPAPRTWFDTCPGLPATRFFHTYQYLAGMRPCWTRTRSWPRPRQTHPEIVISRGLWFPLPATPDQSCRRKSILLDWPGAWDMALPPLLRVGRERTWNHGPVRGGSAPMAVVQGRLRRRSNADVRPNVAMRPPPVLAFTSPFSLLALKLSLVRCSVFVLCMRIPAFGDRPLLRNTRHRR